MGLYSIGLTRTDRQRLKIFTTVQPLLPDKETVLTFYCFFSLIGSLTMN
jgi:phage terminase large subunit-like protein